MIFYLFLCVYLEKDCNLYLQALLSQEKKTDLFGCINLHRKMSEPKRSFESLREWVVDHKLRAVGCLWLSGITGSFAYNWTKPNMKTSVKIIHARLHAQALTLAALAGAAVVEYYDHRTKKKERVAEFLKIKDE
ncbi:uncharacterized protein LOC141679019 [Apium graveolens]|uniref:uncharacterized protein LOC141679019 n=1 Tax=Apium graveolens TaxID=4045 RepID=UPI003D79D2ED